MSLSVIINPVSGGARRGAAGARAALAAQTVAGLREDGEVLVTERPGHAHELAVAAVARGARLVIAWGGDGTVNEVATALTNSTTSLGIVQAGSGNGLARELGVPVSARRAIAHAAAVVTPRIIDVGELGGRLFFNVAGIGFDAHVAAQFNARGAARRGLATYASVTARALVGYRAGTYRVRHDRGVSDHRAFLITLANSSQFGNGARIAPAARVDDGLLDLVVFEERSRFKTICATPRLWAGGIERVAGVTCCQLEHVVIECDHPMMFHVDGDAVMAGTRLEGRVHRAALRVAV